MTACCQSPAPAPGRRRSELHPNDPGAVSTADPFYAPFSTAALAVASEFCSSLMMLVTGAA